MKRTWLILPALATLMGSAATAATIVAYVPTPSSGGISPFISGVGITADDLQRGIGLVQPGSPPVNTYSASGYNNFSLSAAEAAGDVITWGFDSIVAYDLTTLDIAYGRSYNGPQNIEILLSVNNAPAVSIFSDGTIAAPGVEQNPGIDLSAFTNVTEAEFTLIGWNAVLPQARFSIANAGDSFLFGTGAGLVVHGTQITPIPVPAGAVLLGGALVAAGALRRRKKG